MKKTHLVVILSIFMLIPVAVPLFSYISLKETNTANHFAGMILAVMSLITAVLNCCLFFRPLLLKYLRKNKDGVRHVSGIPVVGTVLLLMASVISFGDNVTAVLSLISVLTDASGVPWLIIQMVKNKTLL